MRIRYLKPDFFKDEDIARLPHQTRLFYEGLWCCADKAGRLSDRPERLKAEIFPYESADTEAMLTHLSQAKPSSGRPFIHRYTTDGQRYIQILSWAEHQKPHHTEAESKIPPEPNGPFDASDSKEREKANKEREKGIEKGMEKGTIKQLEASVELSNGAITVIEPVKGTEREKSRRFTPPSPQEVSDYADSIGFNLDGETFVSHYRSKGWRIGKSPMKDWKAAVVTWKKRRQAESQPSQIEIQPTPKAALDLMDKTYGPEKETDSA